MQQQKLPGNLAENTFKVPAITTNLWNNKHIVSKKNSVYHHDVVQLYKGKLTCCQLIDTHLADHQIINIQNHHCFAANHAPTDLHTGNIHIEITKQ